MLKFTDIDFNAVWQETFGWNAAGDTDNRKFNDQAENDFWVRLAPRYTQEYNLNHDTGLIADKLAGLLGRNKTILEIGCGSGNFTLLMAQYSQQILGLDFSPAMLAVLEERRLAEGIGNIRTQAGKWEDFIDDVCEKMNQAVCRYGTEHHIWSMGSTMAMLLFTPESMFACNLGDSRIYLMDGGKLQQISTDHVFGGTAVGKAPLTQYLGLPEELQRLEPSVTEIEHKEGYRYLLCSDGVTDMLSDSEIEAILSQDMEIPEIVNDLLKNALQKGGRDNVTIVLCEVQKLDTVRRMKEWMKNLKDKK